LGIRAGSNYLGGSCRGCPWTIIVAFVIELARGHSGAPYTWLGAIAGLAYIAAIAVVRARG
jgi:hypothetical protein